MKRKSKEYYKVFEYGKEGICLDAGRVFQATGRQNAIAAAFKEKDKRKYAKAVKFG